jgi:hypothetical protein
MSWSEQQAEEDAYWERVHQRAQEERQYEEEMYNAQMQVEYERYMFGRWLVEYVGGGVL